MQEQDPTESQFTSPADPQSADMHVEDDVAAEESLGQDFSSSRKAYERRKAYSSAFCHMALDMFLENMPEDLHPNADVFDRQVRSQIFTVTFCMQALCMRIICGVL